MSRKSEWKRQRDPKRVAAALEEELRKKGIQPFKAGEEYVVKRHVAHAWLYAYDETQKARREGKKVQGGLGAGTCVRVVRVEMPDRANLPWHYGVFVTPVGGDERNGVEFYLGGEDLIALAKP